MEYNIEKLLLGRTIFSEYKEKIKNKKTAQITIYLIKNLNQLGFLSIDNFIKFNAWMNYYEVDHCFEVSSKLDGNNLCDGCIGRGGVLCRLIDCIENRYGEKIYSSEQSLILSKYREEAELLAITPLIECTPGDYFYFTNNDHFPDLCRLKFKQINTPQFDLSYNMEHLQKAGIFINNAVQIAIQNGWERIRLQ